MKYLLSKMSDIEKFLSNRDFWLKFVFPVVIAWGAIPYINKENADVMSDQAVALVQTIVPFIATLLLAFSKSQASVEVEEFISQVKAWLEKQ